MYLYNRYLYVHFNYKTIEVYILYYNISPKWSSIIFQQALHVATATRIVQIEIILEVFIYYETIRSKMARISMWSDPGNITWPSACTSRHFTLATLSPSSSLSTQHFFPSVDMPSSTTASRWKDLNPQLTYISLRTVDTVVHVGVTKARSTAASRPGRLLSVRKANKLYQAK